MAKTLEQIADELDQAQDALDLAGQTVGGAGGKGSLLDSNGDEIYFRQLAEDLRQHSGSVGQ